MARNLCRPAGRREPTLGVVPSRPESLWRPPAPTGGGRTVTRTTKTPEVEVTEKARAALAEALRQGDGARYVRIRVGRG